MNGNVAGYFVRLLRFCILLTSLSGVLLSAVANGEPLRFLLNDGSVVVGQLASSDATGRYRVISPAIRNPLEFECETLIEARNVGDMSGTDAATRADGSGDLFAISMRDQSQYVGQLRSWAQGRLVVQSSVFGQAQLSTDDLAAVVDPSRMGRQILSLGDSMHRYQSGDGWRLQDGTLVCDSPGAVIAGRLELPDQFWIRLTVRCQGRPDFALALGDQSPTGAGQGGRVDRRGGSLSRLPTERFVTRLEWFDQSLAMVRSNPSLSDAVTVDVSRASGELDLELFVDQVEGRLIARMDGLVVADCALRDDQPVIRRSLTLISNGDGCLVSRLDVLQWDGIPPASRKLPDRFTLLRGGRLIADTPTAFENRTFRLANETIASRQLLETRIAKPSPSGATCEIILADGSRIRGGLIGRDSAGAIRVLDSYSNELNINPSVVRRFVGLAGTEGLSGGKEQTLKSPKAELVFNGSRLKGRLVSGVTIGTDFGWQSELVDSPLGIVAQQELEMRFPGASTNQQIGGYIELRGGDRIPCYEQTLEGEFVKAVSPWCGDVTIPEANVARMVFRFDESNAGVELPTGLDRERLLQVPRRQKDSLPTHLVVSQNGDVLRTRVISIDAQQAKMDVRGAIRVIPRDRISHVIRLGLPAVSDVESKYVAEAGPLARISFIEASTDGQIVQGRHQWLGDCRIPVETLTRLRVGRGASSGESWELVPMKQPRSEF